MNINDILSALQTATPEQIQILKETVAPETRTTRLKAEYSLLSEKVTLGIRSVNQKLAEIAGGIETSTISEIPPIEDFTKTFNEAANS